MDDLKKHDIVQIVDPTHFWFPALIIVNEIKSWGIIGYLWYVSPTLEPNQRAYIRLKYDHIQKVGECCYIPKEEDVMREWKDLF